MKTNCVSIAGFFKRSMSMLYKHIENGKQWKCMARKLMLIDKSYRTTFVDVWRKATNDSYKPNKPLNRTTNEKL